MYHAKEVYVVRRGDAGNVICPVGFLSVAKAGESMGWAGIGGLVIGGNMAFYFFVFPFVIFLFFPECHM